MTLLSKNVDLNSNQSSVQVRRESEQDSNRMNEVAKGHYPPKLNEIPRFERIRTEVGDYRTK